MKNYLTILAIICFQNIFFAQQSKITGTVTDPENIPLSGVTIVVKNTTTGTLTDKNGNFSLKNIPIGETILSISYVGFRNKEVTVTVGSEKTKDIGSITLFEGNELLSEVFIQGERKNKFSRKKTDYVSKMPLRDIENTQVYSTITSDLLESQVTTNFEDALKNTAGVDKLWTSTGRGGDGAGYYSLRGFSVQPQLVNGVPGLTNGTINAANIDRIEVIKGPSATLFGNAVTSYGGLINVVTKKPYIGTGGELSFTTGSYGLNQLTADYNTAIDGSNSLYFRLNTSYLTEQSFQDAGFRESFFVAPSLSYQASNKLSFSFYSEITNAEQTNPMLLFLNRTAPTAAENLEELNYNNKLSFTSNDLTLRNPSQNYRLEMDYKLSDNWTSQTIVSRSTTSTKGYYSYLFDYGILGDNIFTRLISKQQATTHTTDIQQNITGDFLVAGLRNRLVAGVDYFTETQTANNTGYAFYGNVTPDGGSIGDDPFTEEVEDGLFPLSTSGVDAALASQPMNRTKSSYAIYSAYASDVINFTPSLSAMIGLRVDRFDTEGDVSTPDDDYAQTAFSPKFGILYQPIANQLSLFANYQNGFTNVAPALVGNPEDGPQTLKTFDPEQANQIEVGIKANLFKDRLQATASYYDIRVQDRVITDPDSPFNRIQGGEVESSGFEIEVNANPFTGLNIRGGYSFNDSETTKSDNAEILNRRPLEAGAEQTYHLWATYEINEGTLQGFGIGAGLQGASEQFAINYESTGTFILPAYTIGNASVFYRAEKYRIGIKVNNLTNKTYYKGWTTISPQMPRALLCNFTYNL